MEGDHKRLKLPERALQRLGKLQEHEGVYEVHAVCGRCDIQEVSKVKIEAINLFACGAI